MIESKDQLGSLIKLIEPAKRIVSLVPSQTELLYDLGLTTEVVGITKFCIHPNEWFNSKERVGGTKSIDIDKVRSLSPDLIIGNKEENTLEDISALREIAPVWMSDVNSLDEAYEMIQAVGLLTDRQAYSEGLVNEIKEQFQSVLRRRELEEVKNKTVLYYIWNEPSFAAGQSTFINDMINQVGLKNIVKEIRYPEVGELDVVDFVFLSSEPFPFKEEHIEVFQKKHPDSKIVLVDGEMFSWYGSRLKLFPQYFVKLVQSLLD